MVAVVDATKIALARILHEFRQALLDFLIVSIECKGIYRRAVSLPGKRSAVNYVIAGIKTAGLRQFCPERLSICAVYFHSQKGEHIPAVQER